MSGTEAAPPEATVVDTAGSGATHAMAPHDPSGRGSRSSSATKAGLARFTRWTFLTDIVVVVCCVVVGVLLRFQGAALIDVALSTSREAVAVRIFSPALIVFWLIALRQSGAYNPRLVGFGADEYSAVVRGTAISVAALAIAAYVFKFHLSRGFVLITLPLGLIALLLAHKAWRNWLCARRRRGELQHRVLVVGDQEALRHLIRNLDAVPEAGYGIVGACCGALAQEEGATIGQVPVVGQELDAPQKVRELDADVVACTTSAGFGSLALRRLAWRLERSDIDIIVVPDVIDVAGPRVMTRPVNGTPLLLIEQPRFEGINLTIKTLMDKVITALGLLVASPLFLGIAIAIKLDDGGPVIFRQERVGIDGTAFEMLKFRSMRVGADREHEQMIKQFAAENSARGPLFKAERDPRITRTGRWLRRTSLDELPQLWNILRGDMSLVGPRPPLPREVASYDKAAMRRLLVKPGLTGMWQVSGRSNLSWEESLRLDLYYVENWSLMGDLMIMVRTVKAVVRGEGAY